LECMRASGARRRAAALPPPPAERDYPLAKGSNNTHIHTHIKFTRRCNTHPNCLFPSVPAASALHICTAEVRYPSLSPPSYPKFRGQSHSDLDAERDQSTTRTGSIRR
jgi:hypothetical protein